MDTFFRKSWAGTLTVAALLVLSTAASGQTVVPVPKVTGPIAVTADSVPFLASDKNLVPLDLAKAGYVEEEFIVSGSANVYDWGADGALSVKTPNAPYATRILVRRPANASRSSGNVFVELMNTARRFDWPMMWGYSRDHFIENGDTWIGVTMPAAAAGLKKFNPTRYAAVSFANPSTTPCTPTAALSDVEEGLRWDALSQIVSLLKSNVAGRPLAGLRVEAVFLATQGGDVQTYINAIHPNAKLANGKPVFDGYLLKSPAAPSRINQCATAPAVGDPRRAIRKTNVPVIAVVAQGEIVDALAFRRLDSDAADDKFRMYEIAGAGHIEKSAYSGFPLFPDQIAAAGTAQGTPDWPFTAKCDPEIPMMPVPIMTYAFDASYEILSQWVRKGIAAPHGTPLQVKDNAVVLDANGHGVGGVRNPYVEVPRATYFTNSTGPGVCREMGREVLYDGAKFQMMYPTAKAYTEKVAQSADRLVKERWLTESDAKKIKQEAQARAK
jgi:hypothetical protein